MVIVRQRHWLMIMVSLLIWKTHAKIDTSKFKIRESLFKIDSVESGLIST